MRELRIEQTIMGRDSIALAKYLIDISKISLLSIEEEVLLTKMSKNGDKAALEKLIITNLRFVVSVAKNYQHRGLSLGDLINEGNIGLIKAALKFDETKGFKFISFAVWWIRQSIMLAISDQTRAIRLPLNLISIITKINKTSTNLEQQLERLPTIAEISKATDIEEIKILEYLENAKLSISLDEVINLEIGHCLLDVLADENSDLKSDYKNLAVSEQLSNVLYGLSKREINVLYLYYGIGYEEPKSLEAISTLFNLSRERIRQIKDRGLKKLRAKVQRIQKRN